MTVKNELKIGIVMQNDYPHIVEVRARKFIMTFKKNFGLKPIVMCAASVGKNECEHTPSEIIFRFSRAKNVLYRLLHSPSPLNFLWIFFIISVVKKEHISLLLCSNIRIAVPAIIAAKITRIPVVIDLQENNTELAACRPKDTWIHRVTRNRMFVYVLEFMCVRFSDAIWTVTEEMRDCVIKMGIPHSKVNVLYNVPELDVSLLHEKYVKKNQMFTLIYAGMLEAMRGLDTIINALHLIVQKDTKFQFIIIGYGEYRRVLEELIESLHLGQHIHLLGRVQREDVPDYLREADVGIISHQVNSFTNTTMPNKLFDYMAEGLPVLSTDMVPVRRIIHREQCGVIIPLHATIEDIAREILSLKESFAGRKSMGERGREAIVKRYNWNIESEKCIKAVEKVLNG